MMKKFLLFAKLFALYLLTYFGSLALSAILFFLTQHFFKIPNTFFSGERNVLKDLSSSLNIIMIIVIIISPIMEELIFRKPLKEFQIKNFIFSLGLYFIFLPFNTLFFFKAPSFSRFNYGAFLFGIFICIGSFLFTYKNTVAKKYLKYIIVILVNLLFAILHFKKTILSSNQYDLSFYINLIITIIPYFFMGIYFTFLRIKYSIYYAISFHLIANGIYFLLNYFI